MYIYVSINGRSKYPCFWEKNKRKIISRPVTKIRPVTLGYKILNTCNWLQDLVKDMEYLCLNHLFNIEISISKYILRHIYFSKKHIPPCIRICSTFFTHMVFVGGTGDSG